jgi:hypothetical protein
MRVTRVLLMLVCFSAFTLTLQGQAAPSLQVEKSVGQTLTVGWDFPAASEIDVDSFVVEHCTGNNTGCNDLATVVKTARLYAFTVLATSRPFYQVRSVKGASRSLATNPVALTIKIPPPLGAWGQ